MEVVHKNSAKNGLFVAQENGQRIGYISYDWLKPNVLGLMHTVVSPEYRGHGVAKTLLDTTVKYARENGILIHAVCSYAVREFQKSEYDDVNYFKQKP
ncbi:MAG: N-acetyltransferase [Bacteroidales bacterium]|nr:N-acetyltransferase [Bacteroidales bacterium]